MDLLTCPACDEPCAEIPPCTKDCLPGTPPDNQPRWCEDRRGACACGARLYVSIDDGFAELVEEEADA